MKVRMRKYYANWCCSIASNYIFGPPLAASSLAHKSYLVKYAAAECRRPRWASDLQFAKMLLELVFYRCQCHYLMHRHYLLASLAALWRQCWHQLATKLVMNFRDVSRKFPDLFFNVIPHPGKISWRAIRRFSCDARGAARHLISRTSEGTAICMETLLINCPLHGNQFPRFRIISTSSFDIFSKINHF